MTTTDSLSEPSPADSDRFHRGYTTLLTVAAVTLVLDQLTKYLIVVHSGFERHAYPPFGGFEVIPGFFSIVYTVNTGAAWGLLAGRSEILAVIAIAAVVAIFVFRRALELHRPLMQLIFGLILGGIVGNLIDRLFRGHVVDFLDFHFGFYRWPTFNLADSWICIGTVAYVILSFFPGQPETLRVGRREGDRRLSDRSTAEDRT